MDIRSFAQKLEPKQRQKFVEIAGTNSAYLSQVSNGHRKAGTDLAKKMVDASKEIFPNQPEFWLTLSGIRPDIWPSDEAA